MKICTRCGIRLVCNKFDHIIFSALRPEQDLQKRRNIIKIRGANLCIVN